MQLTPDVRLSTGDDGLRMRFAVLLPTEGFDYERSSLNELYRQVAQFPGLSVEELRSEIRSLPCCTKNKGGNADGDPLNVVIIGDGSTALSAMTAGGWSFTDAITVASIRRMVGAAIADNAYLVAPVSALYAFGGKHDIAMQRGRSNIALRNHARFWLAPYRYEGDPVWVGQISRDIGVKLTSKSASLTTHVIDANVDEAREYLLHSLLYNEAVEWFAFAGGVGAATPDEPRTNLVDDPYYTDGMRLVVRLSRKPIPPERAVNLGWNDSTDPIRQLQGRDATVN